jgi:hypothetical protein
MNWKKKRNSFDSGRRARRGFKGTSEIHQKHKRHAHRAAKRHGSFFIAAPEKGDSGGQVRRANKLRKMGQEAVNFFTRHQDLICARLYEIAAAPKIHSQAAEKTNLRNRYACEFSF